MRQRRLKDLDRKLDAYSGGIKINPKAVKGSWQKLFEMRQPVYMELGSGKGQFILKMAREYPDRNFIAAEGNRSVMLRALQKAERILGNKISETENTDKAVLEDKISDYNVSREKIKESTDLKVSDSHYEGNQEALFSVGEKAALAADDYDAGLWATSSEDCIFRVAPNLIFANMYLRSVEDCFSPGELSGIYLNFSDPWPKKRCAKRRLTHKRYLEGYKAVLKPDCCLEFKTDNEDLFRFSVDEFEDFGLEKLEYTEDLHGNGSNFRSAEFMTEYEEKFSSKGKPIYYCKVRF